MDKNDVGVGFAPLKIGDTVQEGDQRYVDFCWIAVPRAKIGKTLARLHWPMRRKMHVPEGIVLTSPGALDDILHAEITDPRSPQLIPYLKEAVQEAIATHPKIREEWIPRPFTPNKYTRDLLSLDGRRVPVDVYSVLAAFPSNNGAVDHALKKQLAPGQRGQKDRLQDLKEARASLDRAIQMEEG